MPRKIIAFALFILVTTAVTEPVEARSIRVDGGGWQAEGTFSGDETLAIGFDFGFFGFSTSEATISPDGLVGLAGGGGSAELFPFFEPDQLLPGNTAQYTVETTDGDFLAAGIDAGFRVTWQITDAAGALLNAFQMTMFSLSNGQFVLEFNFDQILFGDDNSEIGFDSTLGGEFDLIAELGLSFADYSGVGDLIPGDPSPCPGTPDALACNNYFDGVFDPSANILPGFADGYFQTVSQTNLDPAQGRYLFVSEAVDVPEPSTLMLLALGLLGLGAFKYRAQTGPARRA